jgi:hypothetical protein
MKNQNTAFTSNFYLFILYSLCLGAFVAEIQLAAAKPFGEDGSIKNNKLCETNPIFQKVKCL